MGFLDRATTAYRIFTGKMTIDQWWADFGPGSLSTSSGGIAVTQVSALQVATVLACVSILSEDVAKLPVHVYRRRKDGGKQIVTGKPGEPGVDLERLLQSPNNFQSGFEFREQLQASLLLRGNAYACILRDGRGRPNALIPVNPDRVWIYEAPSGDVFYQVARRGPHDTAMLKSLPLMVHSDDMLHLRWFALDNSLYGASRIQLARETIGLALSQQELASRLSANNTNLGGTLETDQKLTKDIAERVVKSWKDNKAGLRNAGAVALLEQGLKWKPLGMTAADAEFMASRQYSKLDIAGMFRMPPHKIGVMERMAGNSLEQIDQDYVNNTVSSHLGRWEAKIDDKFELSSDGLFVEFDVGKFLRASLQTRYTAYRTGIIGMFLKPNEARRAEGLPDDPDGDKLYQPVNVAPLGFEPSAGVDPNAPGLGSDITGSPADGGRGDGTAVPSAPGDEPPPDSSDSS